MGKLTLGSLFDGSGGFPLGGLLCGIEPLWSSEIEPFPIRVTTKRIPQMKRYGDISTLNGADLPPVDIITFGSPCTDMSVAGKRAGLDGSQSVLFYEAIRIIKEMRCKTDGRYPRYAIWENVPGAFSSNKGADFKAVLEAVVGIARPNAEVSVPENGRWPYADCYMGDGWSVAYRTVDAQFFGVPQRRRRIYLVADFTGGCAFEVLFERKGVSRDFAPRGASWQGTARNAEGGAGTSGDSVTCLNDQGGGFMSASDNVTATLRAEEHGHPPCVIQSNGFCTEHSAKSRSVGYEEERSPTLRAGVMPGVAIENHPTDSRIKISEDGKVQTLSGRMGTGGMNVPLTMQAYGICSDKSNSMLSENPLSGIYEAEISRTIDANGGNPGCNQGGIAVVALQGPMLGRKEKNRPQGSGINEDVSFSLTAADRHAVAYAMTTGYFSEVHEDMAATLMARDYKDMQIVNQPQYAVRRLTPTECARLQGFPDYWCSDLGTENPTEDEIAFWSEVWETHRKIIGASEKPKSRRQIIKWLKNPHSDAAEYKMWGNGVALPCVCFVLTGIVFMNH
ncbi:DNA cytosine methyltransferase [Caproicibacterium amylolyticum]|uniref:DNA (cytosine-5-)-methyltransferase n=1 Tax=Caproicibacterium amylolyticum TaxID=2766537 RepID=A0A7G9WGT2_9FIRM|nr:DNA cytosine methyltransferase [Caproicibacterium amylolyticum]QNO17894.1 DNA cytosine methyltransferase [Caproicibacterium amylolyticum]